MNLRFVWLAGRSCFMRALLLLAVTTLVLGVVGGEAEVALAAPAAVFQDLPSDQSWAWAEQSVAEMKAKGLISGYEDGSFRPKNSVSREEVIAMLIRVSGREQEAAGKTLPVGFVRPEDVSPWAHPAVAQAVWDGVITSDEILDFRPKEPAKRWEIAVFAGRAAGWKEEAGTRAGETLGYTDASSVPQASRGYVSLLKEKGVMGGNPDGSFGPLNNVTRVEMSVVLARLDALLARKESAARWGEVFSVSPAAGPGGSLLITTLEQDVRTFPLDPAAALFREGKRIELTDLAQGAKLYLLVDQAGRVLYAEAVAEDQFPAAITSTVKGRLVRLEDGPPTALLLQPSDGNQVRVELASDTSVRIDSESASPGDLAVGQEVEASVRSGIALEVRAASVQRNLEGEVGAVDRDQRQVSFVLEAGTRAAYRYDSDTSFTLDGRYTQVEDLVAGQNVLLTVKGRRLLAVNASSIVANIEGILVRVEYAPQLAIILRSGEVPADEVKLPVAAALSVLREGTAVTLRDLLPGDNLKVQVINNTAHRLEARATRRTLEGTVKAVTIAASSLLTILSAEGREETLTLAPGVVIRRGSENLTAGQLGIGDYVELQVDSSLVKRIDVRGRRFANYVIGLVYLVNERAQVIVVQPQDAQAPAQTVFLDSGSRIIRNDNRSLNLSELRNGDEVITVGRVEGGLFFAETILVVGSLN